MASVVVNSWTVKLENTGRKLYKKGVPVDAARNAIKCRSMADQKDQYFLNLQSHSNSRRKNKQDVVI